MPGSYTLGQHFEAFIRRQVSGGRYNNASEVVRDALRLLEEREQRLAALDAAIERGNAQLASGEVYPAGTALDDLDNRYHAMQAPSPAQ